jgi:hypothetical protein
VARRGPERYVVDGKGERVDVILTLDEYQRLIQEATAHVSRRRPGKSTGRGYNFAGLRGRLRWKGDAVAAQRALRDAW